jgi:hypothetical protein
VASIFSGASLAQYRRGAKIDSTPWATGNKLSAVVEVERGKAKGYLFQTYDIDSRRKLSEVELPGGAESQLSLSLDGRHLFASAPSQSKTGSNTHLWHVYAVDGVGRGHRLFVEGEFVEGVVLNNKLFALVDLSGDATRAAPRPRILLRCYGLNTGRLLWERGVVGTTATAPPEKKRVLK